MSSIFKKILILILVSCFLFAISEITIRAYSSYYNVIIAANDIDYTYKELYNQYLKKHIKSTFWGGANWPWDYDQLLGKTPNKNYNCNFEILSNLNSTHKLKSILFGTNTNSMGMRQLNEVNLNKTLNITRISILGDSFTYGEEVATKLTYPALLNDFVPNSEILNFGMDGAGLNYMYLTFKNKMKPFNSDVLIITFYECCYLLRDLPQPFKPFIYLNETNEINVDGIPIQKPEEFVRNYKLPNFESYLLNSISYKLSNFRKTERAYNYGSRLFEPILKEINTYLLKENKSLLVVLIPTYNYKNESTNLKLNVNGYEHLKMVLFDKKIAFVDGHEVFPLESKRYNINEKDFFYSSAHLTPLGNAVLAKAISLKLYQMGITDILDVDKFELSNYDFTLKVYNRKKNLVKSINGYKSKIIPLNESKIPLNVNTDLDSTAPLKIICHDDFLNYINTQV